MTADGSELARHWTLDEGVVFLNHGSFGACPRPVLDEQSRLRAELEREPIRFLAPERELGGRLDEARTRLAELVGSRPEDLVFVPNATFGVNSVLRSLPLERGDELVVTDHGYNACSNVARYVAERAGASLVVAEVPFPTGGPGDVVDALDAAITERTRLVLVDHVTSPTGLVWPVEELVALARARGCRVLVDGAHGPGMLPLDLDALDADYYTGNCHKWLCSPKGSGLLRVRPELQEEVRPAVVSHGANTPRPGRSRFQTEFDWTGTIDVTPYLCVPAAIDFLDGLVPGGLDGLRARNRALALEARSVLADALDVEPPAPDAMIGSLATLPLPPGPAPPEGGVDPLQRALFERHRIEVPVSSWAPHGARYLRVSAQAYNAREQYERLADALAEELTGRASGR